MHACAIVAVARVHKKEKRVSNCTIPAYKHSLCSTKYTCVCLVLHSDLLLSKQLYKSIVDDLRTSKTVFGQLDTLLFFLYTLGGSCIWRNYGDTDVLLNSTIRNYSLHNPYHHL